MGRSNVGKSSIIRALTGKPLRRGRRPGVTKRINRIQFDGLVVIDFPGYGFMSGVSEVMRERIKDEIVHFIEAEEIDLAVHIVDAKSFVEVVDRHSEREIPIDVELFEFLRSLDIDTLVAVNKIDKIEGDVDGRVDEIVERLGLLPPWRQWKNIIALTNAKKGDVEELRDLIRGRLHRVGRDALFKFI